MIYSIFEFEFFWWIVGIVVSLFLYLLFAKDFKLKWYQGIIIGLINLVILAIGAKLLYIAEQFESVLTLGFTFGGFSLFGAIFIMPLAFYINHLIFKVDTLKIGSLSIIPLLIMLAFYRLDCYKNGCCGGILINGYRIQTQIIEALACLALAAIYYFFTFYRNKMNGECYYNFFIAYGLLRFIVEFFRERENLFWLIAISHIWALASIILGIILTILYKRKNSAREQNL